MQSELIQGKRILLADDQQGVRESIRMLLEVDGHTVLEAHNGKEAFELYSRQPFDLVITDFAMPQMTGKELAELIKLAAPRQPILMITAYAEELGAGQKTVDVLLDKPFSFRELRRAIVKALSCATRPLDEASSF